MVYIQIAIERMFAVFLQKCFGKLCEIFDPLFIYTTMQKDKIFCFFVFERTLKRKLHLFDREYI